MSSELWLNNPANTKSIQRWDLGLIILHSERPKLYTILAFLSALGLKSEKQGLELVRVAAPELGSPAPYPLHHGGFQNGKSSE